MQKNSSFNTHDSKEEAKIKENNTLIEFGEFSVTKQKELLNHLDDLKHEYNSKVNNLQLSLDDLTRENEAYCCQITALKQHNEYQREASNQWRTRYNHSNILLLNAEEEILNLKTELTNMTLLYNENISHIENQQLDRYISDINIDNKQTEILKQYMNETKHIKSENIKYLNQLEDITNKYTETNIKYTNLTQMQKDMQHELNEAKSKINELNNVINEYFIENTYLENKTNNLKQTLNEINNTQPVSDCDSNLIHVSDMPNSKPYLYLHSMSYHSICICNTPIVHEYDNNYKYIDPYNIDEDSDVNTSDTNSQMEHLYDLYQAMNDYLFQIDDCIQSIKIRQLLCKKTPEISDKFRSSESNLMYFNDKKQDSDDCDDEVEFEKDFQMISNIDEEQLIQIQNIVAQLKNCLSEMHKEQIAMIENEKMKYNILDETYQQYKINAKKKIKVLKKDVHKKEYKKCNLLYMAQFFK